jgi:hypothetical protein
MWNGHETRTAQTRNEWSALLGNVERKQLRKRDVYWRIVLKCTFDRHLDKSLNAFRSTQIFAT